MSSVVVLRTTSMMITTQQLEEETVFVCVDTWKVDAAVAAAAVVVVAAVVMLYVAKVILKLTVTSLDVGRSLKPLVACFSPASSFTSIFFQSLCIHCLHPQGGSRIKERRGHHAKISALYVQNIGEKFSLSLHHTRVSKLAVNINNNSSTKLADRSTPHTH